MRKDNRPQTDTTCRNDCRGATERCASEPASVACLLGAADHADAGVVRTVSAPAPASSFEGTESNPIHWPTTTRRPPHARPTPAYPTTNPVTLGSQPLRRTLFSHRRSGAYRESQGASSCSNRNARR